MWSWAVESAIAKRLLISLEKDWMQWALTQHADGLACPLLRELTYMCRLRGGPAVPVVHQSFDSHSSKGTATAVLIPTDRHGIAWSRPGEAKI